MSIAASEQRAPAAAWGGRNYLVVWQQWNGRDYDVYGTRMRPSGRVLNPRGIPISTARDDQSAPAVAWDGTNFLVVWEDVRSRRSFDVYGARMSPTGSVLDRTGIPVSRARGNQYAPTVAWGGSSYVYVVAWEDTRGREFTDIYATRVSRGGRVADLRGFAVSTAAGDQRAPDVAYNGRTHFVVWEDARSDDFTEVFGARVGRGRVLDPDGIALTSAPHLQFSASVACRPDSCLVLWADSRSGSFAFDVHGTRVGRRGAVLDREGIRLAAAPGDEVLPEVAWDGSGFTAAWRDAAGVVGARVDPLGGVSRPARLARTGVSDERALALAAGPARRTLLAYDRFVSTARYRAQRVFGRPLQVSPDLGWRGPR